MEIPRLQYQLSNGTWIDCEDRDEDRNTEFFGYVVENNTSMTRDEICAALMDGRELRNDPEDWYSFCRSAEVAEKAAVEQEARERAAYEAAIANPRSWGSHGTRFDESCGRCGRIEEVDNDTGLCRNCD